MSTVVRPRLRRSGVLAAALLAIVGLCLGAAHAGALVFKSYTKAPPASAPVGESITYAGTLFDDDTSADDLSLTYSVENQVGFVSTALGGTPELNPPAPADFTGFGVINGAPGTNATATVAVRGVPVQGGPPRTFTFPISIAVTEAVTANLSVDKVSASVLDRITYTLEITNNSDSAANLSDVSLPVPEGTTAVSYTQGETSLTGGGATTTFTGVVEIDDSRASGTTVVQSATASYSMPGVGLPTRPVQIGQQPAVTTIDNSGLNELSVVTTGPGSGTVTGPGISCPGDCAGWFPANSTVELTPRPAGGSVFAGWQGDCNGTGSCPVLMSGERAVIARFEPAPVTADDTTAPETKIDRGPKRRTHKRKAKFVLSSSDAASFECQLDFDAYAPCARTFARRVGLGRHRLLVRATDGAGNVDATPAEHRWRVVPR